MSVHNWTHERGPQVPIGGHLVGQGCPAFIVAEAGVNHDGRLDQALQLVDVAVDAGADAVKFQVFRADELATASAPTAAYQRAAQGGLDQRALLATLELTQSDFARIRDHCTRRNITFLATPFTPADVGRLTALDVSAIKLASTDLTNGPLLDAAAATDKSLIVSTGASTAEEIGQAVARLADGGARDRLVLLHCISAYPTPLHELNLVAVVTLRKTFGIPAGLSDHTTSTQTGAWAVALGACVLEKHFTLDRSAPGPDHAMSLDPRQLTAYIDDVRALERACGDGRLGMTDLQADVRAAASKSLVASADIPAGTLLTAELLTLKRPGTGLAPGCLPDLIGRRTSVAVPADTLLSWSMVE